MFFVVSLVALLCLGVTLPAVAKIKVGGMITQDVFYYSANDSRTRSLTTFAGAGVPSFPAAVINPESTFSTVDFRMPQALNRLNVAYSNDDNTIRGFFEVRGGSGTARDNLNNIEAPNSTVVWNYAWIDWVLSPNDFIRFGRQTQAFAIKAPSQMMGQTRGHIVGANFGNVHGGASRDGVRWYHTFTDQFRLEVALYDPDSDGGEAIAGFTPQVIGGATATVLEENVIPRIDLALPMNFGSFSLEPSFTYLQQKYDQVGPGSEDSVDIWGIAVGGQVAFGPLVFDAEVTYGQNLGVGNYAGAGGTAPAAFVLTAGGPGQINDADIFAWWLDVGWKIGPATLHGIVGASNVEREDDPTAGGSNIDFTNWMYGLSCPISVAKGFTIRPEAMVYDFDNSITVGNTTERDGGKEFLIGVQFQLVF